MLNKYLIALLVGIASMVACIPENVGACEIRLAGEPPSVFNRETYQRGCDSGDWTQCVGFARVLLEHDCSWDAGMKILQDICGDSNESGCYLMGAYRVINRREEEAGLAQVKHACEAEIDQACLVMATYLEQNRAEPLEIEGYLRTACYRGDINQCTKLVESARRRGDKPAAAKYYVTACRNGIGAMCVEALREVGEISNVKTDAIDGFRKVIGKECTSEQPEVCLALADFLAAKYPVEAHAWLGKIEPQDLSEVDRQRFEELWTDTLSSVEQDAERGASLDFIPFSPE